MPLFGDLDERSRAALARRATQGVVRGGTWLFHEGDAADFIHLIVSGRLEAVHAGDGSHIRLFGPGDVVGELAVLARSPRTASVRALRDSRLLSIAAEDLQALLRVDPAVGAAFVHNLAIRLGESHPQHQPVDPPPAVIAVTGEAGSPTNEVLDLLVPALGDGVAMLGDRTVGADPSSALDRAERDNRLVVLDCGAGAEEPWREFALRQADRVLTVARAGEPTPDGDTIWWGAPATVGPASARSRFVVRPGTNLEGDIRRVARRLRGRSVGLVLSGGGARALAHLGVLRVLAEHDIEVDRVGGTSMGAAIAALVADGHTPDQALGAVREEFCRRNPFRDYAISRSGLIRGNRVRTALKRLFGERTIESLPIDYFGVSADLLDADLVVHRNGPIWSAVMASGSLPGYAPPFTDDGRWLVDGGVLDNLPVAVMAAQDEGPVIAVDVMSRGLGAEGTARRVPNLVEVIARSVVLGSWRLADRNAHLADLLIKPDVHDIGLLDFNSLDRAVAAGRLAAENVLSLWRP